jgi:hypothetical protein
VFVKTRKSLLRLVLAAGASLLCAAPAAASPQPGGPCSNATVSAQNQYCENIPSATGGREASPGTPALVSRLPPAEVTALRGGVSVGATGASGGAGGTVTHAASTRESRPGGSAVSAQARQQLLSLPAPTSRIPLAGTSAPRPSSWSLFSGLIIALAVATLAAGGLAFARRRRGGSA